MFPQSMSDNAPESPTWSTGSTHVCWPGYISPYGSFGDGPPFEEEEDVLFPYWETREHDLFEEEAVLREFVRIHERQERSLWDYLGPE